MTLTAIERDQFEEVDQILMQAITSGNPLVATNYGAALKRSVALKGVALAKLLYGMRENWSSFESADIEESFEDFVEAHMDVDPQTTRKYASMWEHIFESQYVQEETKKMLQVKPIGDLLLLTTSVEEGSLSNEELKTAAIADRQTIREMIKNARGQTPQGKTAVYISIYMQDGRYPKGTIVAHSDDGEEDIGFLYLEKAEEDYGRPFLTRAIARIKSAPGMLERR